MNLKKLAILGLVASSALVLSACDKVGNYGGGATGGSQNKEQQSASTNTESGEEVIITFTDDGFSPAQVTVKSGGAIKWVNNSSAKVQAASDPHPTHTTNPEITDGDFVIELAPGASSSVKITKSGTWGFHDHLKPAVRGKIVVQ